MSEKEFNNFPSDEGKSDFEDIVSSSSMKNTESNEAYALSDFSSIGKGKYRKKPRGFKGWWQKRKAWQKSMLVAAVSLILILAIGLGTFFVVFDYNYNNIKKDDLGFENVIDEKIVNIALFGIDTRNTKSFKGNSDSIMILSLNADTKKVKVISVMRDSLVPITYNGKTTYSKINSAYAKGGPELAIKTLNTIFDLDISEYATVNFFGMVDIIDAVGGIDAELTSAEVRPVKQFAYGLNACISEICNQMGKDPSKHYITKSGKYHLNGVQAVAYSRIRYVSNIWGTSNDYGRTDRQRHVMEQLFNKAKTLEKSQYIKLVKALIPCTETSLSYNEIIDLSFSIILKNPTFEQARIPMQEYVMPSPSTRAGSVVYYDLDFVTKLLHSFIYDEITPEAYIEANGVEKNDWYRKEVGVYVTPSTNSGTTNSKPTESEEPIESEDTTTTEPQEPSDESDVSDESDISSDSSPTSDSTPTDSSTPEESSSEVTSSDDSSSVVSGTE
ncbi:MAG: LCP family protein [Clostridia bacterium]|nr:LCP family protein [Clostridia bacterium]